MSGRRDGCPDNLLARSVRGGLSLVEQRALDAHLGVCDVCRATMALRNVYEQIPDLPLSHDRAVVARLAGAVSLHGHARRANTRAAAFAAGAALTAIAGAAAAWVVLHRAPSPNATGELPPPRPSAAPLVQAMPPTPPVDSPTAIASTGLVAPAPSKRAVETRHVRATLADSRDRVGTDRGSGAERSEAAADLFAAANAARGAGDLRGAARRYDLLERRYPASPEAAVSLVSAGDLLMRLGERSAALAHFDQYLSANARGALALEALFGRARSLRELGRRHDELEAWRELLRRFPGSLYEATARQRVDELSR